MVFAGTAGTVDVSQFSAGTPIEVNLWSFDTGGNTLDADGTNRTIKLKNNFDADSADNNLITIGSTTAGQQINIDLDGSTRTFTIAAGDSVHFVNTILSSGSAGVTKAGAGTLRFSGANTYTGTTNVNAGTLLVTNASGSATGSGGVELENGSTLGGTGIITGLVKLDDNQANNGIIAPAVNGVGT